MIRSILLVGLGGCIGSILRYLVSTVIPWDKSGFPTATFIVNIAGCLLIGLVYGLLSKYSAGQSNSLYLLLTTGFCGGFTTFSTFSNEAVTMLQSGNPTGACSTSPAAWFSGCPPHWEGMPLRGCCRIGFRYR